MSVADWILLLQVVGILGAIAYGAANCPAIRSWARNTMLPGWDDEDMQSAARKWRNHAKPYEYTNRELQALKATGIWPK